MVFLGYFRNFVKEKLFSKLNLQLNSIAPSYILKLDMDANVIRMLITENRINSAKPVLKLPTDILVAYLHVEIFLKTVFAAYHTLNYRDYITPSLLRIASEVDRFFIYEAVEDLIYKRNGLILILIQEP